MKCHRTKVAKYDYVYRRDSIIWTTKIYYSTFFTYLKPSSSLPQFSTSMLCATQGPMSEIIVTWLLVCYGERGTSGGLGGWRYSWRTNGAESSWRELGRRDSRWHAVKGKLSCSWQHTREAFGSLWPKATMWPLKGQKVKVSAETTNSASGENKNDALAMGSLEQIPRGCHDLA